MKNSLPVLCNLSRRGIELNTTCPVCCSAAESILHILKHCSYARLFWALSTCPNSLIMCETDDLLDLVQKIRSAATIEQLDMFICCCWRLWCTRNAKVFEGHLHDAQESTNFICRYVAAFKEAQTTYSNPRPLEVDVRWNPPEVGAIKINYDASFRL